MCAFPAAASAQGVVGPERKLDPARAQVRDGVLLLRDSLVTIGAASARLQRDMDHASDQVLQVRSRLMSEACARSARAMAAARGDILSYDTSKSRTQRVQLERQMNDLRATLDQCESQFGGWSKPGGGEDVRGYAVSRALRVQESVRLYEGTVDSYLKSIGIRIRPLGAGPSPLAGSVREP
ncbi:MAG: hypothetical protein AB7Q69_01410 [Gemmatimonadales bacterium]